MVFTIVTHQRLLMNFESKICVLENVQQLTVFMSISPSEKKRSGLFFFFFFC